MGWVLGWRLACRFHVVYLVSSRWVANANAFCGGICALNVKPCQNIPLYNLYRLTGHIGPVHDTSDAAEENGEDGGKCHDVTRLVVFGVVGC